MANLETLFAKKQYEEVIRLTKNSVDPSECLYHLSSLVMLNRVQEAIDYIDLNQIILEKKYPLKTMHIHFELLLETKLFKEAKEALKHYQSLPYISQEVEEYLFELPSLIEQAEHPKNKNLSIETIIDTLENSDNAGLLSEVLFSLKTYNLNLYIDSLKKMLIREDVHPNLRTFGLILLVENQYDKEIKFLFKGKCLNVIPSKLVPPFTSNTYQQVANYLKDHCLKNVTLYQTSLSLINNLVIDCYPNDIDLADSSLLGKALISLAHDYINEKEIDIPADVIFIKNKIKDILDSTPELKM